MTIGEGAKHIMELIVIPTYNFVVGLEDPVEDVPETIVGTKWISF
jgi:hypothetical protein